MHKERAVIKEILQVLYCEENEDGTIVLNEDKQWDGDTLPTIAEILSNHDYVPINGIHMTPEDQIALVWDADDVIDRAEETHDMEITKEEAREIVEQMKRRHDCNIGINWEVIDVYIWDLKCEKEEEEAEQTRRDEKNGLYPGKEDPCN